ncbi:MAG: hypothetical protein PHS02_01885 [Candidatus ainarchaeum sp.]|nr:hypothetical protein [Candidatus ainarchaeum sp.]
MRAALAFLLILALLHPEAPAQAGGQASQTFIYLMMCIILAALILFALKHVDSSRLFPEVNAGKKKVGKKEKRLKKGPGSKPGRG